MKRKIFVSNKADSGTSNGTLTQTVSLVMEFPVDRSNNADEIHVIAKVAEHQKQQRKKQGSHKKQSRQKQWPQP